MVRRHETQRRCCPNLGLGSRGSSGRSWTGYASRVPRQPGMSVGPNEFLLNGNVWLPNNPLSCEKFKYAYPPPVPEPLPDLVPDLNLLPEKSAMTEMSDAVCFPYTHIPQDKNINISRNEMQHVPEDVGGISLRKEIPVIDLTNTPDEKPKRKKHVLQEGKTSRKPATPKPKTPKPPRNTETPSGKRKYVRKTKPSEHMDAPSCPLNGNVVQADTNETASVKRRLNLEIGQNQAIDGQQLPPVVGQKVQMGNQPTEPIFDLNSSPNEFIRIPQMPTPLYQPSRRETIIQNHMLNGHLGAVKKFPLPLQKSRREIVHDRLRKFAQNFSNMKAAGNRDMSLQSGMPDSTRIGTKRSHSLVEENWFPRYANDLQAYNSSGYISDIPDTSRYSSYVVESRKRSKEETRQKELTSSSSLPFNRTPSSLRTSPVVPNTFQAYSFTDAERPTTTNQTTGLIVPNNRQVLSYEDHKRLIFLEKMRAQNMMSFDERDVVMTKVPVQTNSLTSQNMIRDYNLSAPIKSAEFRSTNCGHLSTAEKGYGRNNRQEIEIYRP